jgi:small nuclear ribonucleoprotein (snRNP)-like protein
MDDWDKVLGKLIGKDIVVQYGDGIVYQGVLSGTVGGLVILSNAEIIGRKNIAKTDFLVIRKSRIVHLHLKGTVEPKKGG